MPTVVPPSGDVMATRALCKRLAHAVQTLVRAEAVRVFCVDADRGVLWSPTSDDGSTPASQRLAATAATAAAASTVEGSPAAGLGPRDGDLCFTLGHMVVGKACFSNRAIVISDTNTDGRFTPQDAALHGTCVCMCGCACMCGCVYACGCVGACVAARVRACLRVCG